jgi:hypothetical protein
MNTTLRREPQPSSLEPAISAPGDGGDDSGVGLVVRRDALEVEDGDRRYIASLRFELSRPELRSATGPQSAAWTHQKCDAIAALQRALADGNDQSWVEEGQQKHHANRPLSALVAGGKLARSAIVPLTSPSSQERAEAIARIKRSHSSVSILRPWPSSKLGIK